MVYEKLFVILQYISDMHLKGTHINSVDKHTDSVNKIQ
jgi:hypothetical protein